MIVDLHTHIYPRLYLDLLAQRADAPRLEQSLDGERLIIFNDEARAAGGGRPIGPHYWRLEDKLAYMDQHGIDLSVVSLGNPWVDFLPADEAVVWATRLNDDLQAACAAAQRLYAFGTLPFQDIPAACLELRRLQGMPHMRGVITGTRPGGLHLDDPALEPLWSEAETAGLPFFVHPHYTVGADWMAGYGHAMLLALGFTFETTTAITRLILAGVLERHPRLTLILAHSGGTLPYLAGRLDACVAVDPAAGRNLSRPFSDSLRQVYCDALLYHAPGLVCAQQVLGAERLLFGTDHPYGIADPQACLAAVRAAAPTPEAASLMLGGAACRLLNLPAGR